MRLLPNFNLHLYGRPPTARPAAIVDLFGKLLPTLHCADLHTSRFALSFEEVAQALGACERLFFELDGSFVWTGLRDEQVWQLDGMLYDCANHVQRIELKGCCSSESWEQLLTAFGWPNQPIVAHLPDYQCFVEVDALTEAWGLERA